MATNVLLFMLVASIPKEGSSHAWKAYYKQSGLQATATRLERENLSPEARATLGRVALVARVAMDRRIAVTWTFP